MTYLVDELSLFSKIEQNSIPYNYVTFDISEYLENYIDSISFLLPFIKIVLFKEDCIPYCGGVITA